MFCKSELLKLMEWVCGKAYIAMNIHVSKHRPYAAIFLFRYYHGQGWNSQKNSSLSFDLNLSTGIVWDSEHYDWLRFWALWLVDIWTEVQPWPYFYFKNSSPPRKYIEYEVLYSKGTAWCALLMATYIPPELWAHSNQQQAGIICEGVIAMYMYVWSEISLHK